MSRFVSVMRPRPTVRSWRLLQVGNARAPQSDGETSLTANYREARTPMHNAGTYDFYRDVRAPLDSITVRHSGSYLCNGCGRDSLIGNEGITEFEHLKRYGGRSQVPMLFVSDLIGCEPYQWLPVWDCGCCDERFSFAGCWQSDPTLEDCNQCSDDDCLRKCWAGLTRPCVTFAWAMGRISGMPETTVGIQHYRGELQSIEFELELQTPLRRITYERWRYGDAPQQAYNAAPSTGAEIERANAEHKTLWGINIPCRAPACCDREKFWYRDLRAPYRASPFSSLFDINFWEYTRATVFTEEGEKRVYIGGNAEPEVMLMATAGATIGIRNDVATGDSHSFPTAPTRSFVYTNSATGEAWYRTASTIAPLTKIARVPRLQPGVNAITVTGGTAVVGIVERHL